MRALCTVLLMLIVGQSIALGVDKLPGIKPYWFRVSAAQASALNDALRQTPQSAEVVASWGVMGRFSGRDVIFPLYEDEATFPIERPEVVFILAPYAGIEDMEPAQVFAAAKYLTTDLHARVLVERDGIFALAWRPNPRIERVDLTLLSYAYRV